MSEVPSIALGAGKSVLLFGGKALLFLGVGVGILYLGRWVLSGILDWADRVEARVERIRPRAEVV